MSATTSQRRIAFFDVDSTLVKGNTYKNLIRYDAVTRRRIVELYVRAYPVWILHKLGTVNEFDFRQRFISDTARVIRGWTLPQIDALFAWMATKLDKAAQPAAVERLQQHKRDGDYVILVSNMFDSFIQKTAAWFGADVGIGTKLAYSGNICAGQIVGASCAGTYKLQYAREHLNGLSIAFNLADCYGYADTISDLPLLMAVGHPVVVSPDKQLLGYAQQHGWEILTAQLD